MAVEPWPGDFEEDGPNYEVERDLAPAWPVGAGAKPKSALQPQEGGQGAGHQKQVLRPVVDERGGGERLQDPAIQRVQGACREKQGIIKITKRLHSKARITRPKPIAKTNFQTINIGSNLPPEREVQKIIFGQRGPTYLGFGYWMVTSVASGGIGVSLVAPPGHRAQTEAWRFVPEPKTGMELSWDQYPEPAWTS